MTIETQTGTQDPNPTAMLGGLPDMTIPAPEATPAPAEPDPAPPQKFVVGGRSFETAQGALDYANGLADAQAKAAASLNTPAPAQPTKSVKLGNLIFEDPEAALAQHGQQIVDQIRSEQRVIEQNTKFWDDFYLKHSDLKGSELLVDAVLAREQQVGGMSQMTREQAAPILAAKARQEVSKIRNVPSGGQALPSKPAVVAGASGASTPRPPEPKVTPTNFVAELRGMRKKG
jgi:hypothetical protein